MNRKNYFTKACLRRQGFTLIELLVVVGILAVLAIAALIAINPLEAQRRSRDSARLQDMARLSAAIEAFVNDFGAGDATAGAEGTLSTTALTTRTIAVGSRSQGCARADNWLGVDLCDYLKQVPLDPVNGRGTSTINSSTGISRADTGQMGYGFVYTSGNYEFCTRLEAEKNRELLNDGGSGGTAPETFFETGSRTDLNCMP